MRNQDSKSREDVGDVCDFCGRARGRLSEEASERGSSDAGGAIAVTLRDAPPRGDACVAGVPTRIWSNYFRTGRSGP